MCLSHLNSKPNALATIICALCISVATVYQNVQETGIALIALT